MKRYKSWIMSCKPIPRTTLLMRIKRRQQRLKKTPNIQVQVVQEVGQQSTIEPAERTQPDDSLAATIPHVPMQSNNMITEQHHDELGSADSPDQCEEGMLDLGVETNEELPDCSTSGNEPTEEPPHMEEKLPSLCSHTECTANDVIVMTLALMFRHSLTWEAVVDILKMFNKIYGEKKIKASKYSLFKKLSNKEDSNAVSYHVYCPDCLVYIEKAHSLTSFAFCTSCDSRFDLSKDAVYFASLSFESQLKQMMKNNVLADKILNYRFTRTKENENNLEDIYDGSEYKRLSALGGILSSPENFSYSFFTDGVALGKMNNRKKTMWPIYVTVNELPPKDRSREMLLVGLYYGPRDPNQNVFLKPFVDECNKLSTAGFDWNHNGRVVNSKVIPLISVVDSVARPQLLNFQTFSAFYGCTFCYNVSTRTVKRLKFTLTDTPVKERTEESYVRDLQEVYERRFGKEEADRAYRGVKGPTYLYNLKYFNLFTGFVVDYLHNILLGVAELYFTLVFHDSRRKWWAYLDEEVLAMGDLMSVIDQRLKIIRPPTCITRTPRSVKDFGHWKASEWRSWLLFYSIPCLVGLLEAKHLEHIAMLSKATYLLLQKSVSEADVREAHRLFMTFSFLFQKYFGPEYMYLNVHLLQHICKGVLRWGPIWTHNSFMYESKNRQLTQLCKNPHRVVQEVTRKYQILKELPVICCRLASTENTLFFCEDVLEQTLVRFTRTDSCILLGKGKKLFLSREEEESLLSNGLRVSECLFFDRLLFKGMRITTRDHGGKKKNDDSVFLTASGQIVEVRAICVTPASNVVFLVEEAQLCEDSVWSSEHVTIMHIRRKEGHGNVTCLAPTFVKGPCIKVDTLTGTFIVEMPWGCNGD